MTHEQSNHSCGQTSYMLMHSVSPFSSYRIRQTLDFCSIFAIPLGKSKTSKFPHRKSDADLFVCWLVGWFDVGLLVGLMVDVVG